MLNDIDILYTQGSAAVWSAVEVNIGILCNCLAMLKPFVRRHMPWLKSLIGVRSNSGGRRYVQNTSGKVNLREGISHRERRTSGDMYELHSFGRDRSFGDGVGGRIGGAIIEGGAGAISSSVSEESLQEDGTRQRGILVTTTVAMGRSSEGDVSEDDILPRERSGSLAAISSAQRNVGLAPVPAARIAR